MSPESEDFLERVLSDEETRDLETVGVYISTVPPSCTGQVLKFIDKKLPSLDLPHVRRIRKEGDKDVRLSIILCSTASLDMERLKEMIAEHDLTNVLCPEVSAVPLHAPLMRSQFDKWKEVWPLNFRQDPSRLVKPDGPKARIHLLRAIELAEKALLLGEHPVGALVVDPSTDKILAESHDMRKGSKHPLRHALTECIAQVAQGERASPSSQVIGDTSKRKSAEMESDEAQAGYLCKGYDAYVTGEPCTMCAMALVHSRIGRIIYINACKTTGAIGSAYRMHASPLLNHRYKGFRVKEGSEIHQRMAKVLDGCNEGASYEVE